MLWLLHKGCVYPYVTYIQSFILVFDFNLLELYWWITIANTRCLRLILCKLNEYRSTENDRIIHVLHSMWQIYESIVSRISQKHWSFTVFILDYVSYQPFSRTLSTSIFLRGHCEKSFLVICWIYIIVITIVHWYKYEFIDYL